MFNQPDISFSENKKLVREIISGSPITVSPFISLGKAAEKMESLRISCLLVADEGNVVGILTERDIIRALNSLIPTSNKVETVMVHDVISVQDSEEMHVAYHTMMAHGIRHLLVIDQHGSPIGVLTETDFRNKKKGDSFEGALDVAKVMSHGYVAMPASSPAAEASLEMQARSLECVIVTDGNMPIGILTERDMVRLYRLQLVEARLDEVMSKPVLTVRSDALLNDAANLMKQNGIRRLVVTDDFNHVIGLLNEHDLVKYMEDEYIQMLQHLVISQAQELTENRFLTLVNNLPQKICVKDVNSVYMISNNSYAEDLGINAIDIVGKTDFDFFPPELAARYQSDDKRVMAEKAVITVEEPYQTKGRDLWIQTTKAPMFDQNGNVSGVVVIFDDITQHKMDLELIHRRTWALEALGRSNKALIFAKTENELIHKVCESITYQDFYLLAWFGWAIHDEKQSISIVASSGSASKYVDDLQVSWGDNELGNGPTGKSIRLGLAQINNILSQNIAFSPWKSKAEKLGIRSSVSLPVRIEGKVAGALTVYAKDVNAFGSDEVELFEELAAHLGYGIESRRTALAYEAELFSREQQARLLEKSMEDALMAISSTLEYRDPYTAGHQKNVADLSVIIGRELGLDESRIHGLYLAAIVHDIGKIQLPTEILVKPTKLSPQEFRLIQTHPEVGYNILSKIDFPWPLAEIIRQHHEYLDGSGYPRGLKADEILFESKILTVADIVESMSSDRPYRPALGIDVSITQINSMRGNKLDERVVDACIAVLKRDEYIPKLLGL
jgi:PAS domain S-box-containing protein/putative nucleotidyltransferase with HDIG domain